MTSASRRQATRSYTLGHALAASANVASSRPSATTWTRAPSSGNQVSNSVLRKVPGKSAMARDPASVLWSVMVTRSIPRARCARYRSRGSVKDSDLRRARSPALPDVAEYREWT